MPDNVCRDCGAAHVSLNARRCRPCALANILYQEFGTGGPEASSMVNQLVRKRVLKAARNFNCVDCDKRASDYDHRDYNKPLDVVPVCRSCNALRGPAIPKKMTFREFMLTVIASNRFANFGDEIFERLRLKYWPNDPQESELRNKPSPQHGLLDAILGETGARNDAHIADAIGLKPFLVRRIRLGKKPVTGEIILRIHEAFGMPIERIRRLVQGGQA